MAASIAGLVAAASGGGPGAIRSAARLMTRLADEPDRLPELLRALAEESRLERLGPRLLLGVTGPPGSGKSTLTDALIRVWRERHPDRRIGVIAVDPSSPFTGGAVLGDRVRMMRHATDPLVFVRSMASRGHLGGLTRGVKGVIRVMALIGCDVVFLETVGVGQSEVEVAGVADLVAIVLAPGQGDGVQLLKAGLMEIGDLFVVNKADRPDAARLQSQVLAMLQLAPDAPAGHHSTLAPRVHLVSAETGAGVEALASALDTHADAHASTWIERRRQAVEDEIREAILAETRRRIEDVLESNGELSAKVQQVLRGDVEVEDLAGQLLDQASRRKRD
jgi:LAO/AO transport system kinase